MFPATFCLRCSFDGLRVESGGFTVSSHFEVVRSLRFEVGRDFVGCSVESEGLERIDGGLRFGVGICVGRKILHEKGMLSQEASVSSRLRGPIGWVCIAKVTASRRWFGKRSSSGGGGRGWSRVLNDGFDDCHDGQTCSVGYTRGSWKGAREVEAWRLEESSKSFLRLCRAASSDSEYFSQFHASP